MRWLFWLAAAGVFALRDKRQPLAADRSSGPDDRSAQRVTGYVDGRPQSIAVEPVGNGQLLRTDAAQAFRRMQAAARAHRIELDPESGFRTAEQQRVLYERYLAGTGHQAARPGYSNHQAGRSIDLHVGGYESATYRWLSAHAGQFGFRDDVRGEYWHWTFFPSGS